MDTTTNNWIEYGELAIGIGTFTLAIVLDIISYRNSIRDRAVHIADKRQEWVKDFKASVIKILVLLIQVSKDERNELDIENNDTIKNQLATYSLEITLMFKNADF